MKKQFFLVVLIIFGAAFISKPCDKNYCKIAPFNGEAVSQPAVTGGDFYIPILQPAIPMAI